MFFLPELLSSILPIMPLLWHWMLLDTGLCQKCYAAWSLAKFLWSVMLILKIALILVCLISKQVPWNTTRMYPAKICEMGTAYDVDSRELILSKSAAIMTRICSFCNKSYASCKAFWELARNVANSLIARFFIRGQFWPSDIVIIADCMLFVTAGCIL